MRRSHAPHRQKCLSQATQANAAWLAGCSGDGRLQLPTIRYGLRALSCAWRIQIAGFSYAQVNKTTNTPDYHHSLAVGDLRQAQLSALKLPRVGFSTTIDTGDYTNIRASSLALFTS